MQFVCCSINVHYSWNDEQKGGTIIDIYLNDQVHEHEFLKDAQSDCKRLGTISKRSGTTADLVGTA